MAKYKKRSDGFRSGFEATVAANLRKRKIPYEYESRTYAITIPIKHHRCRTCLGKDIYRAASYTPDFHLSERLVVETKGKFTARDRKLAVRFKAQAPGIDYRILFQRDNKLAKSSKTRYTDWCAKNNIPSAVGEEIPDSWLSGT